MDGVTILCPRAGFTACKHDPQGYFPGAAVDNLFTRSMGDPAEVLLPRSRDYFFLCFLPFLGPYFFLAVASHFARLLFGFSFLHCFSAFVYSWARVGGGA